jgi:hypothetical protein
MADGLLSPILKAAEVLALTQQDCIQMLNGEIHPVEELHICAMEINTDTCSGDSGGYLFI